MRADLSARSMSEPTVCFVIVVVPSERNAKEFLSPACAKAVASRPTLAGADPSNVKVPMPEPCVMELGKAEKLVDMVT